MDNGQSGRHQNLGSIDQLRHVTETYQIPLATLQGWEQGRRNPDRTASAYLNVIARLPNETRTALHP